MLEVRAARAHRVRCHRTGVVRVLSLTHTHSRTLSHTHTYTLPLSHSRSFLDPLFGLVAQIQPGWAHNLYDASVGLHARQQPAFVPKRSLTQAVWLLGTKTGRVGNNTLAFGGS